MDKLELINCLSEKIEKGILQYGDKFLLGKIVLEDKDYDYLFNLFIDLINTNISVSKNKKNKIISIALVNFAIKDYKNDQFWYELGVKSNCNEKKLMKESKKAIESFCKKRNLYFHIGNINKGYVTTILVHAIIPNSNLNNFIEFLQDLYFKDLEEDYTDQKVEKLLQYMHKLFSKYLDDEDISFIVQGSKMTIARQQLPKSFRIAYVNSFKLVKPILERLLLYIDQLNYGEKVEYLVEDRFEQFFLNFENGLKKQYNLVPKRKKSRSRGRKKYNIAKYSYENQNIILEVPRQIIKEEYISNELYIEILFADKVVTRKKLKLTKSRLLFKTEHTKIRLDKFNNQISYRIISGNDIIYKSKKKLKREFLIFDLDGREVSPKNISTENIRVIIKDEDELICENAEITKEDKSNYKVITVFMNKNSMIIINDKIFSSNNNKDIKSNLNKEHKHENVLVKNNKKIYQVYSKFPEIRLRMSYGSNIEDYLINIKNQNYQLSLAAKIDIKNIFDGSGDKLAIIRLNDEIYSFLDPIRMYLRKKGTKKKIIDTRIFLINSLEYKLDKNYYYKEKKAKVIQLNAKDINFISHLNQANQIDIRNQSNFKLSFKVNEDEYCLIIKVPILSWQFGDINSKMKKSEELWWEDVKNDKLLISFPYGKLEDLHIITSKSSKTISGTIVNDKVCYNLDNIFHLPDDDLKTLGVIIDGNDELITNIHFKPKIDNLSIAYSSKNNVSSGLYADWDFYGKGKLLVDIISSKNSKVIKKYKLSKDENIADENLDLNYGKYEIEIYQMKEDDFFFEEAEKIVLAKKKFVMGDLLLIESKNTILKAMNCICNSESFKLDNFYLKDIRFASKKGYYEATGFYYIRDRYTGNKKEWYFTRYNPFLIKPVQEIDINSNEFEVSIVDKEKDGLLYDLNTTFVNPKVNSADKKRYKLIDTILLKFLK